MSRSELVNKPDAAVAYDWLEANGVDEWIPEDPILTVTSTTLSYLAFQWEGPRGWNPFNIRQADGQPLVEVRRVPLLVPINDVVLAAFERVGALVQVA